MENSETHITQNEEETIELGSAFAKRLKQGDVVVFYGGLGSGKTEFIKGICTYFEVEEIVTSPTFTIMNQYIGTRDDEEITIYHIDLYRIKTKEELSEIGFQDCLLEDHSIKLIEWAEKANGLFPSTRYNINIQQNDNEEDKRIFNIEYIY